MDEDVDDDGDEDGKMERRHPGSDLFRYAQLMGGRDQRPEIRRDQRRYDASHSIFKSLALYPSVNESFGRNGGSTMPDNVA